MSITASCQAIHLVPPCILFGPGNSVFCSFLGVYDGHEGSDVSQYLANHLHERVRTAITEMP